MAQRVVCVVGPTASGKTKMGVALAKRFNGEVVSVDSMQIYRGMEIGTAAPTPEEMAGVPHHMIGVADPAESWSVSRFTQEADRCIQDILRRGKLPVLVGGTGLYLDALVQGQTFAAGQQGGAVRLALQQRRCWRSWRRSTRRRRHGCTCGTKSAFSGRWRSTGRRVRLSASMTGKAGRCLTATTPCTSG